MRLTEKEVISRFQSIADKYAPLRINRFEEQVSLADGRCADAIIEFSIPDGSSFEALVEIKSLATPKTILETCRMLADFLRKTDDPCLIPMMIAPYIGKEQAKILAEEGISWMDLSGNMVVRVANQIYIERTGKPNKFPDTAPIKKIFQGTASLVSRALLLKPKGFSSLYEVVNFINSRNANITLSTVSKVLKSLEEELLIRKSKSFISVINSEKLLKRLTDGYIRSTERKARKTYKFTTESITKLFYTFFERQIDYVACGFYAAKLRGLATTDQVTIFVKDIEQVKKAGEYNWIQITPDAEFGDISITEVKEPGVWFNAPILMYDSVVDDIELYLEMIVDTPRGPKIAKQLKQRILRRVDVDE